MDGTTLVPLEHFLAIHKSNPEASQYLVPVHPAFRVVALGNPPQKHVNEWVTGELLPVFDFVRLERCAEPGLMERETKALLVRRHPRVPEPMIQAVCGFSTMLYKQQFESDAPSEGALPAAAKGQSPATVLSLRQLLRIFRSCDAATVAATTAPAVTSHTARSTSVASSGTTSTTTSTTGPGGNTSSQHATASTPSGYSAHAGLASPSGADSHAAVMWDSLRDTVAACCMLPFLPVDLRDAMVDDMRRAGFPDRSHSEEGLPESADVAVQLRSASSVFVSIDHLPLLDAAAYPLRLKIGAESSLICTSYRRRHHRRRC
jgi:hypothetical protein